MRGRKKTEDGSLKTEVDFFWDYFFDRINGINRILFYHEGHEEQEEFGKRAR